MLHLYALFAEYIHILCIYTVYIRSTCIPPGACADYSTRKEFTPQKQKARDPFVSRLALKEFRVSFSLYAPENGPPAALHAAHSSSFWALGSCLRAYSRRRARVYPRTVPDRQNPPAPLARVYFAPRPLWWARRRAAGSVVQPVYSVPPVHRTIYTKAGFGRAHGSDAAIVL